MPLKEGGRGEGEATGQAERNNNLPLWGTMQLDRHIPHLVGSQGAVSAAAQKIAVFPTLPIDAQQRQELWDAQDNELSCRRKNSKIPKQRSPRLACKPFINV